MVWGYAKRLYRFKPESSREDVLLENALDCLDSVPLLTMQRYAAFGLFSDALKLLDLSPAHIGLQMHIGRAWMAHKQHGQHGSTRDIENCLIKLWKSWIRLEYVEEVLLRSKLETSHSIFTQNPN